MLKCCYVDVKVALSKALDGYLRLPACANTPIATRLDILRRQYNLLDTGQSKASTSGIDNVIASATAAESSMQILDDLTIPDLPAINSRAGLYIYLNALVSISLSL